MGLICNVIRKIQAPEIKVDDDGKAQTFRFFSIARPHMRAFHSSWSCVFIAFASWFSVQPFLPTIQKELHLTKVQIANSGIAVVASSIIVRLSVGPFCDKFGPKRVMSILLICGSIPTSLAGLVKDETGLIILRFAVGLLGATFVPSQFWSNAMFSSNIMGTANAVTGGFGNMGTGFAFLIMPELFQLIVICGASEYLAWKVAVVIPGLCTLVAGILILFTADDCPQGRWGDRKLKADVEIFVTTKQPPIIEANDLQETNKKIHHSGAVQSNHINDSDQGPNSFANEGYEGETSQNGQTQKSNSDNIFINSMEPENTSSAREMTKRQIRCNSSVMWAILATVVLFIQNGMCFGTELAINSVMNLYFLFQFQNSTCLSELKSTQNPNALSIFLNSTSKDQKQLDDDPYACSILDQTSASLIASLFGLLNLFARPWGGFMSDKLRSKFNVAGRLLTQFSCLLIEGVLLIIFSYMKTIPYAILLLILFSFPMKMAQASTYAICPYVAPSRVGLIMGIVAAGANALAVLFNFAWSKLVENNPRHWFFLLGLTVTCSSFLTIFLYVKDEHVFHIFKYKSRYPGQNAPLSIENSQSAYQETPRSIEPTLDLKPIRKDTLPSIKNILDIELNTCSTKL